MPQEVHDSHIASDITPTNKDKCAGLIAVTHLD